MIVFASGDHCLKGPSGVLVAPSHSLRFGVLLEGLLDHLPVVRAKMDLASTGIFEFET
jgi:hypothetical protein